MMQPSKNSKEFGDLIMFIAQVSHCYPKECTEFRKELMQMLDKHATVLDAMLRRSLVQALILIRNRGLVEARELLPLFFKLFRCQDKLLRKQIFQHIVADLQRSNAKHRDDKLNRKIQKGLGCPSDCSEDSLSKLLRVSQLISPLGRCVKKS